MSTVETYCFCEILEVMDIDFSPITNSRRYELDKPKIDTTGRQRARTIWLYIFLFFTIIAIPYVIYKFLDYLDRAQKEGAERVKAIQEFTKVNGFNFVDNTGKFISVEETPIVYNLPFDVENITNANEITGVLLNNYHFEYSMSSLFVKVSGGDNSQFPYNIFTVQLPVTLPKMFINSKSNNLSGLDAKAVNFEQAADFKLEGDFPKYYDLRIEKNEHIDMYTVLTPEVMDTLKRNHAFDVWLSNNQLTLITFADQARYFAGIPQVFENAVALMKEIDKIARAIRADES